MTLRFRCPPAIEPILARPIPALLGLPDWFKALPQKSLNPTMGGEGPTVKKCPPFIDAMTYGFLMPLAVDLARYGNALTSLVSGSRGRSWLRPSRAAQFLRTQDEA